MPEPIRSWNRREILTGMLGAALVGTTAEARPIAPERVDVMRRRRYDQVTALHQRWYEPQPDLDNNSLKTLLTELQGHFGPWYQVFAKLNQVGQMHKLVDTLAGVKATDDLWTNPHGPMERFGKLYDANWDAAAMAERLTTERIMPVHGGELVGLATPAEIEDFFMPGKLLPKGWLMPIKHVRWKKDYLHSPFVHGNVAGMALPTPESFISTTQERTIQLSVRGTDATERSRIIYHEFAHANDWDTGIYPVDQKIALYWKTLQAYIQSEGESHSIAHRHFDERSAFDRWQRVMEYWPKLVASFCLGEDLDPRVQELVQTSIQLTDPDFDPEASRQHCLALFR